MDEDQIRNNTMLSLETLKYIFEVKLGNNVNSVSYHNIAPYVSYNSGLTDLEGQLCIDSHFNDPDLISISSILRYIDKILNEVFTTYNLTDEGNLVKTTSQHIVKMMISYSLHDLKYDIDTESIQVILSFILFDV